MGYLLEYDETNPISIETYGKRLIGKTFQDIAPKSFGFLSMFTSYL